MAQGLTLLTSSTMSFWAPRPFDTTKLSLEYRYIVLRKSAERCRDLTSLREYCLHHFVSPETVALFASRIALPTPSADEVEELREYPEACYPVSEEETLCLMTEAALLEEQEEMYLQWDVLEGTEPDQPDQYPGDADSWYQQQGGMDTHGMESNDGASPDPDLDDQSSFDNMDRANSRNDLTGALTSPEDYIAHSVAEGIGIDSEVSTREVLGDPNVSAVYPVNAFGIYTPGAVGTWLANTPDEQASPLSAGTEAGGSTTANNWPPHNPNAHYNNVTSNTTEQAQTNDYTTIQYAQGRHTTAQSESQVGQNSLASTQGPQESISSVSGSDDSDEGQSSLLSAYEDYWPIRFREALVQARAVYRRNTRRLTRIIRDGQDGYLIVGDNLDFLRHSVDHPESVSPPAVRLQHLLRLQRCIFDVYIFQDTVTGHILAASAEEDARKRLHYSRRRDGPKLRRSRGLGSSLRFSINIDEAWPGENEENWGIPLPKKKRQQI
ncbi:hypothetical protein F66182_9188 [Fusarium sp. NRRL 66182]|nr:hypothetical protein F66182_9188 [Fusarium sp. NRRL 66182]